MRCGQDDVNAWLVVPSSGAESVTLMLAWLVITRAAIILIWSAVRP